MPKSPLWLKLEEITEKYRSNIVTGTYKEMIDQLEREMMNEMESHAGAVISSLEKKVATAEVKMEEMKEHYYSNEQELRSRNVRLHKELKAIARGEKRALKAAHASQCHHVTIRKGIGNMEVVNHVVLEKERVMKDKKFFDAYVPKCLKCGMVISE